MIFFFGHNLSLCCYDQYKEKHLGKWKDGMMNEQWKPERMQLVELCWAIKLSEIIPSQTSVMMLWHPLEFRSNVSLANEADKNAACTGRSLSLKEDAARLQARGCAMLITYHPRPLKHTNWHTSVGFRQQFSSWNVLKAHTLTEPKGKHTHTHKHTHLSCIAFTPPPSCPTYKFQGQPLTAQSSIKTMMLPGFLSQIYESITDARKGCKGFTACLLSLYFSFPSLPSLILFVVTFSIALFSALFQHIHIICRDGRDTGPPQAVLFSIYLCLYMFSASFNINNGESEIWMLRAEVEAVGTLDFFAAHHVCVFLKMWTHLENCFHLPLYSFKL